MAYNVVNQRLYQMDANLLDVIFPYIARELLSALASILVVIGLDIFSVVLRK